MIVVFTYPDRPALGVFAPQEATNTTLAMEWAKTSFYAPRTDTISVLDARSYIQDRSGWNKRSSIDLYLLLTLSESKNVIKVFGPMPNAEVNEFLVANPNVKNHRVPLFKTRHAFEVYKPNKPCAASEFVSEWLESKMGEGIG
jgi:hypothetical protein